MTTIGPELTEIPPTSTDILPPGTEVVANHQNGNSAFCVVLEHEPERLTLKITENTPYPGQRGVLGRKGSKVVLVPGVWGLWQREDLETTHYLGETWQINRLLLLETR